MVIKKRTKADVELAAQQRAIKKGRGLGQGKNYQPFIQITRSDFSSHGRSQVVNDSIIGRAHHFLSRLEYFTWLVLIHLGAVQIREQFPLGVQDDDADFPDRNWEGLGTVSAAAILDIKHPIIAGEQPRVQSTDLLVGDTWVDRAVFIRYEKDVPTHGRQLGLLRLHTRYWHERGIKHYVMTEKMIDYSLVDLLIWAYASRNTLNGASQEFLEFAANCSDHSPLRVQLEQWRGPEHYHDAVNQFKAGVFCGQIDVKPGFGGLQPLTRQWNFRVTNHPQPDTRMKRFFDQMEAQHV